MDSNDIERERGITILAKNCAIEYGGTRINIVDTPGHADFGGEVERVLSMVDGVLLLVDAVEGPMPQTRFVTRKALALGTKAIVVVNKIDRPGVAPGLGRRPDLRPVRQARRHRCAARLPGHLRLGAAGLGQHRPRRERRPDMSALFEAILSTCRRPPADADAPLQLQISTLDYNSYVGRIGIGRIRRGTLRPGQQRRAALRRRGSRHRARSRQVLTFTGLRARQPVEEAAAGDIVAVTGIEDVNIGLTICDLEHAEGLPPIQRRRADAGHEFPGQHLAASPAARASSSPAGRSASGCTASCRATSRCASRTPTSRTCSASRAAASCI